MVIQSQNQASCANQVSRRHFMNFLMVVPRYASKGNFYNFPVGIASVYTYLKHLGFNVFCLNLCHSEESLAVALATAIEKHSIDVVCTGGMSFHWDLVNNILECVKRINPSVRTVVGGPLVTADPELAINYLSFNFGVIGEGEVTMSELAAILRDGGNPAGVKGLIFHNAAKGLILTEEREAIADLNSLPIIDYDAFGFDEWSPLIKYAQQSTILESYEEVRYSEILGSRSCPFSCTFCYHPLGKKYRQRSLDHLFSEIDTLTYAHGVNFIGFMDELFSVDHHRLLQFAERIKPYKVKWFAQMRVNDVTGDLLEKLVESGLLLATFGIESMNDKILKSMKKHTTRAEIERALKVARETRFYCTGNIILGDPADTRETMQESITWWMNHPMYNVSLGFILAVPDAPIYRQALEKGLIRDKLAHVRSKFPLVNLTSLSDRKYFNLVFKVAILNLFQRSRRLAELVESLRLEETHNGNPFHLLRIKCPFCEEVLTYRRFMASSALYLVITCESCFASFKVHQSKAFPKEYNFLRMISFLLLKLAESYGSRFRWLPKNKERIKGMLRWSGLLQKKNI